MLLDVGVSFFFFGDPRPNKKHKTAVVPFGFSSNPAPNRVPFNFPMRVPELKRTRNRFPMARDPGVFVVMFFPVLSATDMGFTILRAAHYCSWQVLQRRGVCVCVFCFVGLAVRQSFRCSCSRMRFFVVGCVGVNVQCVSVGFPEFFQELLLTKEFSLKAIGREVFSLFFWGAALFRGHGGRRVCCVLGGAALFSGWSGNKIRRRVFWSGGPTSGVEIPDSRDSLMAIRALTAPPSQVAMAFSSHCCWFSGIKRMEKSSNWRSRQDLLERNGCSSKPTRGDQSFTWAGNHPGHPAKPRSEELFFFPCPMSRSRMNQQDRSSGVLPK